MDIKTRTLYRKRALSNRCPRCGQGKILKHLFARYDRCPRCDFPYAREDGFFSAALPINYSIVVVVWLLPLCLLWLLDILSGKWTFILGGLGAAFIPIFAYRYSQCIWLGAYYFFVPDELEKVSSNDESSQVSSMSENPDDDSR